MANPNETTYKSNIEPLKEDGYGAGGYGYNGVKDLSTTGKTSLLDLKNFISKFIIP